MNSPAPTPASTPSQLARTLLAELQKQFAVFRDCLPLSVGIDKELIARMPEVNRKVLRIALGIHTKSTRYLNGMVKAKTRFNLDGNAADEITAAHRAHASTLLEERFKKAAEQRKSLREANNAQRKSEAAERQRSEKLTLLVAKFSHRDN